MEKLIKKESLKVFKVYYQTLNTFKNAIFFAEDIKPFDINKTHVFLIDVLAVNLDNLFAQMKVENWRPGVEVRKLLQSKGLSHTSMIIGDIAYSVEDDKYYLCKFTGWENITNKIKNKKHGDGNET